MSGAPAGRILLVAAIPPSELAVVPAVTELVSAGYEVSLALGRNFRLALPVLDGVDVHLLDLGRPWLSGPKPGRWTPAWAWVVARNLFYQLAWRRVGRRVLGLIYLTRRTWHLAHADPWFRDRAREATVMVALDRYAVYAVWKAARRYNSAAPALHGLTAVLQDLTATHSAA
jgi:hypothetical protein